MNSPKFEHIRHRALTELSRPRELIVACPPLKSQVNLSRIARVAGCCAVERLIVCGAARLNQKIARDADTALTIETRRSLAPVLDRLRNDDYRLVGLEQTTNSRCLFDYRFERRTVLIPGHERNGLTDELLQRLDVAIEIPIYGMPHSLNVATATAMALYEYCRQFPSG